MTRIIDVVPEREVGHVAGGFPADLAPNAQDYLGYFTNQHGEEIVFIQTPGEEMARLIHSDYDWEPVAVREVEGMPVFELILDEAERSWLYGCWAASRLVRQMARD